MPLATKLIQQNSKSLLTTTGGVVSGDLAQVGVIFD